MLGACGLSTPPETLTVCLWSSGRYSATQLDGINCIPPCCSRHAFRYWLDAAVDLATGIKEPANVSRKSPSCFLFTVSPFYFSLFTGVFVQGKRRGSAHGDQRRAVHSDVTHNTQSTKMAENDSKENDIKPENPLKIQKSFLYQDTKHTRKHRHRQNNESF